MARQDPLLPNAAIVARREYRDRVRSPLFIVSTIILMGLAVAVALVPIGIRYLDRTTVTTITVVASDDDLGRGAVSILDTLLNIPPVGREGASWSPPFRVRQAADETSALGALQAQLTDAVFVVERLPSGQLDIAYRTNGVGDSQRAQLVTIAAFGLGVLDWNASRPEGGDPFFNPRFRLEPINVPVEAGEPVDAIEIASRSFLGTVFIILMFISILIYGMWVATGVATEKSSRVMELMISAASPRQLVLGKVVGIGGAGLTQYLAIAAPALVVLAMQETIARNVLGDSGAGLPTGGLTIGLLLAYGAFFLMGFTLFAFVYAAVGSFVSRPDDLQTLSLPLSLVAMAGYLSALVVLLGGGGSLATLASFVPPLSPFAMTARLMVSPVQPWEVALSVVILLVTIVVVALGAIRIYATGVLLYGQRPGLRRFIAAARRAG
jgi:ABC-2 type transport system permease protein